ncbi:hypothetical protein GUJ93_ZPchr0002g26583 [Zizania palustris]|uniref:Uncharacterized protein n=1 Tax=Zizania palustris TaxID=103762 RepID=A0A8J5SNT0_ZIZPA|nr:hypothetical protein GUJ93_ZPchr0002g26583 [Zizania palustris]
MPAAAELLAVGLPTHHRRLGPDQILSPSPAATLPAAAAPTQGRAQEQGGAEEEVASMRRWLRDLADRF